MLVHDAARRHTRLPSLIQAPMPISAGLPQAARFRRRIYDSARKRALPHGRYQAGPPLVERPGERSRLFRLDVFGARAFGPWPTVKLTR